MNSDNCLDNLLRPVEDKMMRIVNSFIMGVYQQSFDYARLYEVRPLCSTCQYQRTMNEQIFCTNQKLLRAYDMATNDTMDLQDTENGLDQLLDMKEE